MEVSLSRFTRPDRVFYLAIMLDVSERHEVERLKREFVAMVSHDLRSPLSTTQLVLAMLKGGAAGSLSPEDQRLVSVAETETSRLITFIELAHTNPRCVCAPKESAAEDSEEESGAERVNAHLGYGQL